MTIPREYLSYIHNFRGFAIILIVGVHLIIALPWSGIPQVKNAIYSFTNNGTILFVFIAGFLFYYLSSARFTYWEYLIKKIKFVILPYLIISIPALIDKLYFDPGDHWWMTESFQEKSDFVKTLIMLGTGRHSGPLWFIPMIGLFYICSYPFLLFARTKSFDILAPLIFVVGLFTVRFGYYADPLISFLHFFPVYLMGIWACKFKDIILKKSWFFLFFTGIVYLTMGFLEVMQVIPLKDYLQLRDMQTTHFIFNLSKLKAMFFCFFLMTFFFVFKNKKWGVLKLTGDYSFGIFFLHLYLINILQISVRHGLTPIQTFEWWSYLIAVTLVVGVSMVIIKITKVIFGKRSRMILGS